MGEKGNERIGWAIGEKLMLDVYTFMTNRFFRNSSIATGMKMLFVSEYGMPGTRLVMPKGMKSPGPQGDGEAIRLSRYYREESEYKGSVEFDIRVEPRLGTSHINPMPKNVSTEIDMPQSKRRCGLDWCNDKHYAKEFCELHYRQWRKLGTTWLPSETKRVLHKT